MLQAAIKNVIGDAKQIAAKTKNMEDMTGFFKTKFTGKQESVKNVLSAVSVISNFIQGLGRDSPT